MVNVEEAFQTSLQQNEAENLVSEKGFDVLYQTPERLQEFMDAISGIQIGNSSIAYK